VESKAILAEQIRALRAARNWMRVDLAEKAKLAERTLAKIEHAQSAASLDTLDAVAQAFEVSPHELLQPLVFGQEGR
jgi:transcriptional regulator with XRE-family HTH domain